MVGRTQPVFVVYVLLSKLLSYQKMSVGNPVFRKSGKGCIWIPF